ncbi:hypothetical protein [Sphingobium herbicidovorans]|uniref:hypothetical protein n=1 Tax=Sphingobium herbicidovorans TaxID=76947 RepID=UPI0007881FE8|nr:hypothetical protein [Sphingobium herbicidovorans]
MCELQMTPPTDVYAREVVMARVNHLIRRKQNEIERIARIIRACFEPETVQAPQPGKIRLQAFSTVWSIYYICNVFKQSPEMEQ